MARTVVYIGLTVMALKPWQAGALVGVVSSLPAGPAIEALRRCTWQRRHLTGAPAVPRRAVTVEGAMCVDAEAIVHAGTRLAALIDVAATVLSLEARRARAVVVVIPVGASGTVSTGAGGTGIDEGTVLASEAALAHAGELRDAVGHLALAPCSVEAWCPMAGVEVLAPVPDVALPAYASGR